VGKVLILLNLVNSEIKRRGSRKITKAYFVASLTKKRKIS